MKRLDIIKGVALPVGMLLIMGLIMFVERKGISADVAQSSLDFLPQSVIDRKPAPDTLKKECLVLLDPSDQYSDDYYEQLSDVLQSMSVGYDTVDVLRQDIPPFDRYQTVALLTPDFAALRNHLMPLFDWVDNGGRMLVVQPVTPTPVTKTMMPLLGIHETTGVYKIIEELRINTDFMIGAKGFSYNLFVDGILAINLQLSYTDSNLVHAESNNRIPLLWEHKQGMGLIVVNNLSVCSRESRGYYAAAYSLLQDVFAYPVIASSLFFIDDFLAPLPIGYNEYITKFIKRVVRSFFLNVWWPDLIDLSKRYGRKYTGLIIQDYNERVAPPFETKTDNSTALVFGNMLLDMGGEIGYHGYNHQPLCYTGFDFKGMVEYNTFASIEHSVLAFRELDNYCKKLFPNQAFHTYVPPSNILSAEGRQMLVDNFPQIKVISGIYQAQDYEFQQDFDVSPDGIINVPRIISGSDLDGFERWAAISELNLHYVNSHFFHPDDVLDPERGAEKGWNSILRDFKNYISWLYDSAPGLRIHIATEAGKAVQRYYAVGVQRTLEGKKFTIDIQNFYDVSYLLVRIKNAAPRAVSGGALQEISSDLYLLTANSSKVEIELR